jgi:hypothetical protein
MSTTSGTLPAVITFAPIVGRAQIALQALGQGARGAVGLLYACINRALIRRQRIDSCPHPEVNARVGAGSFD